MGTTCKKARFLIACVLVQGGAILLYAFGHWRSDDLTRFLCYLALTLLSSGLKVRLPGITGSMSVAFLFALIGIQQLSLSENLLMIVAATVLQCTWHAQQRPKAIQVLFNVGSIATSVYVCTLLYNSELFARLHFASQFRMLVTAGAYFVLNTLPVAGVIALTEDRRLGTIWKECYTWAFPYYLVGAVVVCGLESADQAFGWGVSVVLLPVMFLIHRSYGVYLGRLAIEQQHAEDQKKHGEDITSLHLRTIESLALAIAAKDHITHDHLRRVQVYAIEIGKEMGLNDMELHALRAAALLHDIGKLAVPEHIISKPGRLTPEEFEKMKIHPVVGAEILERVKFPYPVVPIVRAHHEKWNGKGYPYGLAGQEIPLGARILAAVDCLDAIASDRQYRRALPLDEAMSVVLSEAGKSYDPAVVKVLHSRYHELERMAQNYPAVDTKLSTDLKIDLGSEPACGLELSGMRLLPTPTPALPGQRFAQIGVKNSDFVQSIAAARHEVQALFEMSRDLGSSLSLNETLSGLAVNFKPIIPHDSIAIYILRDGQLIPEYVSGEGFGLFSSLEIPVGQGLSGWVAQNRKPIINGNPSVEPGYLNDPAKFSLLRSALAVPLEGLSGIVGVLTLYHTEKDAFTRDHLRIVMALSSKVSQSIENALRFRQLESSAGTDYLTGLPNARSLFVHLEHQISRCALTNAQLAVLVCDLDGFKQVNDRFGHLGGNRVLQLIAKGIQTSCRDCDYVARMGGDEFVMVLAGFEPGSLDHKVEQLSRMVAAVGREVCGEQLLTLSVGAAFYGVDGVNAEELIANADGRMYTQKNSHRQFSVMPPAASWPRGLRTTVH